MDTTHIYIAHLVVEAATPLAVGSGESSMNIDRIVATDATGLPYIPGTSLAGVIRHELDPADKNESIKALFGYQRDQKEIRNIIETQGIREEDVLTGQGSRILFSSANLLAEDGIRVTEGLQTYNMATGYYSWFRKLPRRDHVKINHRGVAEDKAKFDEQLVYKGARFAFRIELMGTAADKATFEHILNILHQPIFRIGSGTRNGFGKLTIISCQQKCFDLTAPIDLDAYLQLGSSLNSDVSGWSSFTFTETVPVDWKRYRLSLRPQDFFLFGAGFGDREADQISKTERVIEWIDQQAVMDEQQVYILIPATSIKGALSHRVAYHYNLQSKSQTGMFAPSGPMNLPQLDMEQVKQTFSQPVNAGALTASTTEQEWETYRQQIDQLNLEDFLSTSKTWEEYQEGLRQATDTSEPVGEQNPAVKALFGYAKNDEEGARGQVIISDMFLNKGANSSKTFNHVAIDRFTGGSIDGALFGQQVSTSEAFVLDIYVHQSALTDTRIREAFEKSLQDLKNGDLALGGSSPKGHGTFIDKSPLTPS